MKSILYFILALCGIVLIGFIINTVSGTKYQYLADLRLEEGEKELWRDDRADYYTVGYIYRPQHMTFQRLHIATIIVTNKRIIMGRKLAGTDKVAVEQQVYMDGKDIPNKEELQKISSQWSGGYYGRGYATGFIKEIKNEPFSGSDPDTVQLLGSDDMNKNRNIYLFVVLSDKASTFPKN